MTNAADEFLMGGGAPVAKFPTVGTKVVGTVLSYERTQQRDLKTKELKTWQDGSPMYQVVFTLQTDENDPEIPNDNGKRRVFVKGNMVGAVREAVRVVGHEGPLTGGKLALKFVGEGEQTNPAFSPPKLFQAQFAPGEPVAEPEPVDEPYDDEEPF